MNKKTKWIIGIAVVTGLLLAQQPVDLRTSVGTTLAAPTAYGTAPAGNVMGVNAYITNTPTVTISGTPTVSFGPVSTSGGATSTFDLAATAATNVKASGGNVYGLEVFNPNTSVCYLQFYNAASPTLGTSVLHPIGVQAGVTVVIPVGAIAPMNFSTAISTGETTAATGSTQCTSPMTVNIHYQ